MVASDSELEGVYRLLSNEEMSPDEVIDPHIEATLERAASAGICIVIHDTTSFSFSGTARRDGLGMLAADGQQGFFAHVSLAVLPGDARTPLGVCALRRLRRFERIGARKHGMIRQGDPGRESLRWEQQIELVETCMDAVGSSKSSSRRSRLAARSRSDSSSRSTRLKMLLARSFARDNESAPATTLLSPVQLQLLQFRFELAEPIVTRRKPPMPSQS
jgi:hypothetical protein